MSTDKATQTPADDGTHPGLPTGGGTAGGPSSASPIYDELVAELGDPRS